MKTLFIVGAGASAEADLPVGSGLKEEIARLLDFGLTAFHLVKGDSTVWGAIGEHCKRAEESDLGPYLRASHHIRDAMPQATSIDAFIDAHSGNKRIELCGKLGIARSILKAEKDSWLHFDDANPNTLLDFGRAENKWFNRCFQRLNCQRTDLQERLTDFSFIVFNYDRCIEHFWFHALRNYYEMEPPEAAELMKRVRIYHPYGFVGSLPWENKPNRVRFGADPGPTQLLDLSDEIKTYSESTALDSRLAEIRNEVVQADQVVFLGFAFHRLNMELITPTQEDYGELAKLDKTYFATAHGMSNPNRGAIETHLINSSLGHVKAAKVNNNIKCAQLFNEYSWELTS